MVLKIRAGLAMTWAVATAAVLAIASISPLTASANPVPFCTKTASGTVDKYTFPTDCSASAFPTTYHTMFIDILGQCSSTTDDDEYVGINFNGVSNVNSEGYSWQGNMFTPGRATSGPTFPAVVGHVTCPGSSGVASKYAGSLAIKVLMGLNGDDYSINWVARNSKQSVSSDHLSSFEQVENWSGNWWNFDPNGPPVTSVTIRTASNWKLGSQFTVYFE